MKFSREGEGLVRILEKFGLHYHKEADLLPNPLNTVLLWEMLGLLFERSRVMSKVWRVTLFLLALPLVAGCHSAQSTDRASPDGEIFTISKRKTMATIGKVRIVQTAENAFLAEFSPLRLSIGWSYRGKCRLLEESVQQWTTENKMEVLEIRYTREGYPIAHFITRPVGK